MGVYTTTDAEINCKNEKNAKKVLEILEKLKETGDENSNFHFEDLYRIKDTVCIQHSSGRIQNLEYQIEEIWKKVKHLAIEMNAPFMSEADGCFFSNESNN